MHSVPVISRGQESGSVAQRNGKLSDAICCHFPNLIAHSLPFLPILLSKRRALYTACPPLRRGEKVSPRWFSILLVLFSPPSHSLPPMHMMAFKKIRGRNFERTDFFLGSLAPRKEKRTCLDLMGGSVGKGREPRIKKKELSATNEIKGGEKSCQNLDTKEPVIAIGIGEEESPLGFVFDAPIPMWTINRVARIIFELSSNWMQLQRYFLCLRGETNKDYGGGDLDGAMEAGTNRLASEEEESRSDNLGLKWGDQIAFSLLLPS